MARKTIDNAFVNLGWDVRETLLGGFSLPAVVHHYTSAAGLMGIVEKNEIWFSDARFVNDGSETEYGLSVLRRAANKYTSGKSRRHGWWVEKVIKMLTDQVSNKFRPIIFCTNSESDVLNQWRDYGIGHVAYSIALDVRKLIDDKYNFDAMLVPVLYDEQAQERIFHEMIEKCEKLLTSLITVKNISKDVVELAMIAMVPAFGHMVFSFKHPAFAAEKEWRFVDFFSSVDEGVDIEFRASNLGVVPYFARRPLKRGVKLPIVSVTVGPTPHAAVSEVALKMFLERHGHGECGTATSSLPIRKT